MFVCLAWLFVLVGHCLIARGVLWSRVSDLDQNVAIKGCCSIGWCALWLLVRLFSGDLLESDGCVLIDCSVLVIAIGCAIFNCDSAPSAQYGSNLSSTASAAVFKW